MTKATYKNTSTVVSDPNRLYFSDRIAVNIKIADIKFSIFVFIN